MSQDGTPEFIRMARERNQRRQTSQLPTPPTSNRPTGHLRSRSTNTGRPLPKPPTKNNNNNDNVNSGSPGRPRSSARLGYAVRPLPATPQPTPQNKQQSSTTSSSPPPPPQSNKPNIGSSRTPPPPPVKPIDNNNNNNNNASDNKNGISEDGTESTSSQTNSTGSFQTTNYAPPSEESDSDSDTEEEEQQQSNKPKYWQNPTNDPQKELDRKEQRERTAKEMLATEETYVKNIQTICDVYMTPLRELSKSSKAPISPSDVSTMFADVEVIYNVNNEFLKGLRERISSYDDQNTKIGDLIKNLAPYFKTYSRYCNNYDRAIACLNRCRSNPDFKAELLKLDSDERTEKLGLASYLIMPIQRIPRYRMLLEELIKFTSSEHIDFDDLIHALEAIKNIASHLNDAMKDAEEAQKLDKIQHSFVDLNESLVAPSRRFIREGDLSLQASKDSNSSIHIHLFSDIIILSRRVSKTTFKQIMSFELRHTVLNDVLPAEGQSNSNRFELKSFDEKRVIVAEDSAEKASWMKDIYRAIEETRAASSAGGSSVGLEAIQDDTNTALAHALRAVNESVVVSSEEAVAAMKEGTTMLKYGRSGKPHFRRFQLSSDGRYITWFSPKKKSSESVVLLKDVKKIVQGQKTAVFQRHRRPEVEPFSFSLLYKAKTLDIVARTKRDYITWVEGLRYILESRAGVGEEIPDGVMPEESPEDVRKRGKMSEVESELEKTWNKIGDAFTWGQGSRGSLGHGDTRDQHLPLVMKDFLYLDVVTLISGDSSSAAIVDGGNMFTWGSGESGKLGHGDTSDRPKPAIIKSMVKIKMQSVAVGSQHMLALDSEGNVWSWGNNKYGQLGNGNIGESQTNPEKVESLAGMKVQQIACGHHHSAAVTQEGQLYIWGCGEDGQLGLGNKKSVATPTLHPKFKDESVSQVSCGLWHSLLVLDNGTMWAWGDNTYGQAGPGDKSILDPQKVPFNKKIKSIATGSSHCALVTEGGEVYTWGYNFYGQIGNGTKENASMPVLVDGLIHEKVKSLSCGANHCIVLTSLGNVYTWGAGTYGRLGLNDENDQSAPRLVTFLKDKSVRAVSAGGTQSNCICAHMWVPDKDAASCMQCKNSFTMFRRRHHCRNCGGIFCGSCTSKRLPLLRFGFNKPVRVCDNCYSILKSLRA